MPKFELQESVLHDWVCNLTFQMQALLLTAMRGPDENNKYNAAKSIIRYLRGCVIKPAGDWNRTNNNDFMWGDYNLFGASANTFWQDHDEYPHHFIMHLVHCAEVVGYKYPETTIRSCWNTFYLQACESFHMTPESENQMDNRLNDFGCGVHNKKGNIYRIYKDTDETKSSTILGAMQCDVTKEEYDKWPYEKEIIK